MDLLLTTIKILGGVAVGSVATVLAIYWFELDTKCLRWFEPTFRKLTSR